MKTNHKQSPLLSQINGIKHGFFTRNGGESSGVYQSLNCSPFSNDDPDTVFNNRAHAMASMLFDDAKLFGLNQIHSNKVFVITKDMDASFSQGFRDGDAMVSADKGVALSILTADCSPVLFAASNKPIIGAAHAGWGGAVKGIIENVVDQMCRLGATKEAITACIGPTIQQASYEVKDDFIQQLESLSPFDTAEFLLQKEGKTYFDLPKYIEKQCERSGVGHIENLSLDTYALENDFFSFRRNTHAKKKDYGRQISVIGLDGDV